MVRVFVTLSAITAVFFLARPSVFASDRGDGPPSYSINDAKSYGCYVCSLSCTPSVIDWHGKRIVIKEAWLEKRMERHFSLNPFAPRYREIDGYHLCLTLAEGWDILGSPDGPFFLLEGAGHGFAQIGTVVLREYLGSLDRVEYNVLFTSSFQPNGDAVRIKVVPIHPARTR